MQHKTQSTRVKSNKDKHNFGLNEAEFKELVIKLQQGDDELFKRIYLKHFKKSVNYLVKFRGADYEHAYDSSLEALLEIKKKLIANKIEYGNLAYYFTNLAAMKYSKIRAKGNARLKFETMENKDFEENTNVFQNLIIKETAGLVKKALNSLGEDCVKLLKLHFYDGNKWPQIAKIYFPDADEATIKIKSNTLRRRMERKCLPKFKENLKALM